MNLAQKVQSFPKFRTIYHWCLPFIILNGNRRTFSKRHSLTSVQFSSVHCCTEILGFFRRPQHKSSGTGSVFFRFVLKAKKKKGFKSNLRHFLLINQTKTKQHAWGAERDSGCCDRVVLLSSFLTESIRKSFLYSKFFLKFLYTMNKSHGLMISRVHPFHLGKNPDQEKKEQSKHKTEKVVLSLVPSV